MSQRIALLLTLLSLWLSGCGSDEGRLARSSSGLGGISRAVVEQQFAQRRWEDAINTCSSVLLVFPDDCDARYCELLGRTMVFVEQVNDYLLPKFRKRDRSGFWDIVRLLVIDQELANLSQAADAVTARNCSYDLPLLPLRIGEPQEPLVLGEVRGHHTPRGAHLLGAIAGSFRYLIGSLLGAPTVIQSPEQVVPELPALLQKMRSDLLAHDALLFAASTSPSLASGGWWDRDGNGVPSEADELLLDIFEPGTNNRVFDFHEASFVRGEQLPRGALVPTAALPPSRCAYRRWHIDTLLTGPNVGSADGMAFSPDGTQLVLPIKVNGVYQIHILSVDGKDPVCLTCAGPSATSVSDGVRWRPRSTGTLLLVSNRDHAFAVGGSAGGFGQELYAMRSDGSNVTRLTTSPGYATNYHPNWSADGKRVVWGSTDLRTYDVKVADFVDDATGMRLVNVKRLARDTTWTETHGFSADGRAVLVTSSRAGLLSADIYAIDLESGQQTRLTDDPSWDEHAHLSPDGRKLAWMSGGSRPASMVRLNDGALSPIFDFFWIIPGVFAEFVPPAGYVTELTIMDADGTNLQHLTADGLIVADNQWSADSRRILFRQSSLSRFGHSAIRLLTFDDCPPAR